MIRLLMFTNLAILGPHFLGPPPMELCGTSAQDRSCPGRYASLGSLETWTGGGGALPDESQGKSEQGPWGAAH